MGALPLSSLIFVLAPAFNKRFTASSFPSPAAQCNPVLLPKSECPSLETAKTAGCQPPEGNKLSGFQVKSPSTRSALSVAWSGKPEAAKVVIKPCLISDLRESAANWRDLRYSSKEGAWEIDWRLSVSLTNGSGSRVSAMPPAPSLASSPPEYKIFGIVAT